MKHINHLLVFIFIFTAFSTAARAEGGCPPGQYPQQGQGWRACVPDPNQQNNQAPVIRGPIWQDRWQAVATDSEKPILGIAKNTLTKSAAKEAALADCKRQGGQHCEVSISAANGCVSVSVGTSLTFFEAGESQADAERAVLKDCSEGDTECKIYYTSCVPSVRIR